MKWHIALLFLCSSLQAQDTGTYRMELDTTQIFSIKKEGGQLLLEVPGQGQTTLIPVEGNRYKPELIAQTVIEFISDRQFNWLKDIDVQLKKVSGDGYGGRYKVNAYSFVEIADTNNILTVRQGKAMPIVMHPASRDAFMYERDGLRMQYLFTRNSRNIIDGLRIIRCGPQAFIKTNPILPVYEGQNFTDHHPFSRADSLRGWLSPERTCYDVNFYDLRVEVNVADKSVAGVNTVYFKVIEPFNICQVDLFASMQISSIVYHGKPLNYEREFNAVFIRFPETLEPGTLDSVSITYAGRPRTLDMPRLQGGFIWLTDKNGNPWVESVCQGSGASLWWPCKDHQSDKPDSMHIAVTVPDTLMDISNGTLLGIATLPDHRRRFDWFVHHPINNYNVAVNIGKYAHYSENDLHYYYLPYNEGFAKYLFKGVPDMLALFERSFGPYPFKKDGFTLIESPYPMEHQGAISVGSFETYDTAEIKRVMWHETSHEWWGNSVTCSDITELWMHEGFATYAEVLCYEHFGPPGAAERYIKQQNPRNKEPMIGTYDVNDFHLGDIYPKGVRTVLQLKALTGNRWFDLLKAVQAHFKYQSITTSELIAFINKTTGEDFTAFFDQQLK